MYQHWRFISVSVSVSSNLGCLYRRRFNGLQSACSQLHCVFAGVFVVREGGGYVVQSFFPPSPSPWLPLYDCLGGIRFFMVSYYFYALVSLH